jgi:16S rRNA G966 N2-methylase RsmD
VLVEWDARAVASIERNLVRTGLAGQARVVRRDVAAFLAAGPGTAALPPAIGPATAAAPPFGCVFLDPPYAETAQLLAVLGVLAAPDAGWLDEEAVVVAKHFWKSLPPERTGRLVRVRERRFGETALSVYRHVSESAAGGS